jgi:hypothetical protein
MIDAFILLQAEQGKVATVLERMRSLEGCSALCPPQLCRGC